MKTFNYLEKVFFLICLNCYLIAQSGEDDFANFNYTNEIYNRGSSAAAFLEIGVGARATALGNAYTAVSNDPSSIYWNPAGLSWVGSLQISFNHADWLANTDLENVSMVIPINVNNAIGMYFTYLNYVNNQKVRTITQPEGTGEYYGASDLSMGAAYSGRLGKRFSFGFTGKYIRQEIWHEIAQGYALDIGIFYKTNEQWNVTKFNNWNKEIDELPIPDRSIINNNLYVRPDTGEPQATIATSRGCLLYTSDAADD